MWLLGPPWSTLPWSPPRVMICRLESREESWQYIWDGQERQALQYKSVPSQLYNQRSHDTWEESAGAT